MFEIAAFVYLWAMGAWGHWDLHQQTPQWLSHSKHDAAFETRLVIILCLLWPLLIPATFVMHGFDYLKGKFHGSH